MNSLLSPSYIRSLCPLLLAMVTLTVLGQVAGLGQGSRATKTGKSRPQLSRTFAMPLLSPNPSVNLGLIPLLNAYGLARAMQTGRVNPYGSRPPYGGSGSYGGSQGYLQQGYGARGRGAAAGAEDYAPETQPVPEERSLSSLLTASGVPNDNGRLQWPLGLRILAAPGTDELREQIDALFQEAASQAAGGPVNSHHVQEMGQAGNKFRKLLLKDKAERFGMPLAVYNESERFLNNLEHAEQTLKAGLETPGGEAQLTTNAPSTSSPSGPLAKMQKQRMAEVGLHDNSFQPSTITVPVGATIQWTNYGLHRHTVTSDDGRWSSQELTLNRAYSFTFTRPGIYRYHCAIHPQEMRGTIIVK